MPKFIPRPINDAVFKYIFGYKRNIKYTEYLLECLFKKEKGYFSNKIKILNSLKLDKSGLLEKEYEIDIRIEYKDEAIINIEPYTSFNRNSALKSFAYLNNEFLNQFESGDELSNAKILIQYNLIKDTAYKTKEYTMISKDAERLELFNEKDIFIMKIINLKDIDNYNFDEKTKRLLRFLGANNMEEAQKIAKGDEMLMEIYGTASKYIKSRNEQLAIIDKLYYEGMKKEAIKEGYNSGYDSGYNKGYGSGSNNSIKKIAKNMLKSGSDKKYICKVTGLTEKELDKIK